MRGRVVIEGLPPRRDENDVIYLEGEGLEMPRWLLVLLYTGAFLSLSLIGALVGLLCALVWG